MTAGKISKGVLKDIIIVVVGVLVIWLGLQIIFGTENPFFVVSSGSMVPELQVYDVLIVQGNSPFEEVKIGDVIVFNRPSGHDRVIVHRVVSIIDNDPFTLRTKGDANPASIPGTDFPITEEEYIGQVAYVIPQVGYITRVLTPPINYIIIAIIIGIMIFKQISKNKKEKEISFESLDVGNETAEISPIKLDDLDEIPKDDEYTGLKNENNQAENKNNVERTTESKNEMQKVDDSKEDSERKES